jgi:hypothetical protein
MLAENINAIRKNTEALLEANLEVCLKVNSRKNKYMSVSHYHNVGQNQHVLIANKSFENVAKFKC